MIPLVNKKYKIQTIRFGEIQAIQNSIFLKLRLLYSQIASPIVREIGMINIADEEKKQLLSDNENRNILAILILLLPHNIRKHKKTPGIIMLAKIDFPS